MNMRPVDLSDFKAAKKKITKRFKVTKDLLHLSNTLKKDVEQSKSIVQLMNEQILTNKQSPWKGYDIMFYLPITTKKRSTKASTTMNTGSTTASSLTNSNNQANRNYDRYIFLVKRAETTKDLFLLKIMNKENELDVKNSYDMKQLHSIDYGSDELELVLSLDSGDYSLYFLNQSDRDESSWTIASIAKTVVGNEFTIGYSIDFEALTYMMTASGIFNKFPQLNKIINLNNPQFGFQFSNDEAEAEHILDELNWSSSVTSLNDIHYALSNKSSKLNDEIIDFLLQWEEMDYLNLQKKNNNANNTLTSNKNDLPPSSAAANLFANAGGNAAAAVASIGNKVAHVAQSINPVTIVSNIITNNQQNPNATTGLVPKTEFTTSLRDTGDVLVALKNVDEELSSVEIWLEEQINRLSEIQSNLFLIEDESATLETSWQSLNRVQEVITYITTKYSLTEVQEKYLRNPEISFNPILKASNLTSPNLYIDNLQPLYEAAKVLKQALIMKTNDLFDLKASEWKQIQAITSITTQKNKLQEIASIFCNKFGNDIALSLFDWLLKHRTLTDGEGSLPMIIPKAFQTRHLLEDLHLMKSNPSMSNSNLSSSSINLLADLIASSSTSASTPMTSSTTVEATTTSTRTVYTINPNRFRFPKNNQLLQSQSLFHIYLSKFSPLLDILMELSPKYLKQLSDNYRVAVHDRLYTPLLKLFIKDIRSMITYLQPPITLSNCKGFKMGDTIKLSGGINSNNTTSNLGIISGLLQVTFHRPLVGQGGSSRDTGGSGNTKQITSWKVLEVVLLLISPLIENEEAYLKKLFNLASLEESYNNDGLDTSFEGGAGSGGTGGGGLVYHDQNEGKLNVEEMMSSIFDSMLKRLYSISAVSVNIGSSNTTNNDVDGIEAIALLTVLNQYLAAFIESLNQLNAMAAATATSNADSKTTLPLGVLGPSSHAMLMPVGVDVTSSTEMTEANLYSLRTYNNRVFLFKLYDTLKETYEQRIQQYKGDQIKWIQSQKADPKLPAVLVPFHRYPTLVLQICEMCNGEVSIILSLTSLMSLILLLFL